MPLTPEQSLNGSVVIDPPGRPSQAALGDYIIMLAGVADAIAEWGTAPKARDQSLRDFWPTEPVFAGALFSTVARYAGFDWTLKGESQRMVDMYTRILHSSQHGKGYYAMMLPFLVDVFTQDNGGFLETVRVSDAPTSPVVQLNHLDSNRCTRTGFIDAPVIYYDVRGNGHLMKWYQIIDFCEMPSPDERQHGRQYSALTRILRAAQLMRDVQNFKRERANGQDAKQINIVTGVAPSKIETALADSRQQSRAAGLQTWSRGVVVGSIDPQARASVATINLAQLPDGYDEEKALRDYITTMAMAFGGDYQDLAPLPSGQGGSAQADVLAVKARSKGPKLFMSMLSTILNYRVLPAGLTLTFGEQDASADLDRIKLSVMRAEERAMRIKSGEISPEVARMLAVEAGDLDERFLAELTGYVPAETQAVLARASGVGGDGSAGAGGARRGLKPKTDMQEGGNPAASTRTA